MTEPPSRAVARRSYHSPARRRQAEQTRAAILAAAREAFRSAGYAAATTETIASAAGVSAKTVEAAFGSKRGLLAAVVDPLASAGPPRDLIDQIRAADDPRRRLRLVAELSRRTYQASLPEFELLRDAAAVAPEIATVARQVGSRRHANQARLISYLADQRLLRNDLTPREATDIMWALTSYDLYRALVTEQHWPAARYQNWLAATLATTLLQPDLDAARDTT